VTQLMYWPSRAKDGVEIAIHNKGKFIDPDEILAKYDDWEDWGSWPTTSREGKLTNTNKKQEDPYEKKGIIGTFCRTFDIHQAISTFDLPYQPTDWGNRYLPVGSTGASGAVVYSSDQCEAAYLYSHHGSDVVSSQLVNSWDLTRLNKFGELDKGYEGEIGSSPSQKAMMAFAMEIPEIARALAEGEFSDDETPDSEDEVPIRELSFHSLADEIEDRVNSDGPINRDDRTTMINRIAAAKLPQTDINVLATLLKNASDDPQPSKMSIIEQTKVASKRLTADLSDVSGHISDIEIELIERTLKDHYNDGKHIKRVGRKWWSYQDGLWSMDDDERVRGKMQKTFTTLRTERPEDVMPLVAAVGDTKTSALTGSLWNMFTSHAAERESLRDPLHLLDRIDLPIINCTNGELHFNRDGSFVLKKHNPDHFFTTQIGTAYDPDAKCPEWDRFMKMVLKDKDLIRHMEELGGYVVQMSRWLKSWILFHGPTDTGKSTVADVFQAMLGTAAIAKDLSNYGDNKSIFAETGLQGKLLLVDDDFRKGCLLPDGLIKKISEEKNVTADVKYGDDIHFMCRSLPMVLANYWPISRDLTDAFRDRGQVFDFKHKIVDKSDERKALMLEELPGILNRFVAGLSRLRARGRWDPCDSCIEAHEKWVSHANPASMFAEEMLIHKKSSRVKSLNCWKSYLLWFRSSNPSGRPSSKAEFFERMESLIGDQVKIKGAQFFEGIELKNFEDLP